jgi:malate dehydrogenase (oxaloacetate-decarboxylating)(NADP+)
MTIKIRKQDALAYHSEGQPGKIEVIPTKSVSSQLDLALAYSPGVAEPCLEIKNNEEDAYKYTAKGNLVGVISNGTAVLGLGNIGAQASKPVMEGKGVLFKKFAGIDVFDIEINETDPEKFIQIVKSLEPTFGGINLEDIKAPECFEIEERLKKEMNIPVMHDDQHGTAIISAAALLNALELIGYKKIEDLRIVVNGAGAAAVACTNIYLSLGAKLDNIIMCDSKGVIRKDRENLDATKQLFATDKEGLHSLSDAMKDADFFLGLSVADVLKPQDIKVMAKDPIVFALANPSPEIDYKLAMKTRKDIIMATGRSDHPNQVNNVLGFPYIFRGALDVRATAINEEMKLAAVYALADLAKQPVPDLVTKAYDDAKIQFGKEYLIPKPLDTRLITQISPAVAKAAIDSGVARTVISDWQGYHMHLQQRIGIDDKMMNRIINRAKKNPKKIVFAEAHDLKVLKAAQTLVEEEIAFPILLGNRKIIQSLIKEHQLDIGNSEIMDTYEPAQKKRLKKFADHYYEKRKRKGVTRYEAEKLMLDRNYFGSMLVEHDEADALISGLTKDYPKTILPALQIIGMEPRVRRVAGMYIINSKRGTYFFADTTVNVNPTPEQLVDIIGMTSRVVKLFDVEPRVAVLSYSNFGSSKGAIPEKAIRTVELAREKYPDMIIEGDIQANVALDTHIQKENYPFSVLAEKGANTLIFPDLTSGNMAYKLVMEIGGAEAVGPVLLGMRKPVHILQLGSSVRDIVNMASIAVVDSQLYTERSK